MRLGLHLAGRNTALVHLQHLSDALLEITILGGVDERIDAAVELHQHHGEVVVPSR